MEARDLRKKVNELENDIKPLIEYFINNVGECDLNISVELSYANQQNKRSLTNVKVKIYVTV